jgi:hypothetical protein
VPVARLERAEDRGRARVPGESLRDAGMKTALQGVGISILMPLWARRGVSLKRHNGAGG